MKLLRIGTAAVFGVVFCVFAWFFFSEKSHVDKTYPVLQVVPSAMAVSIYDGADELLAGVTAYDAKDGDITEKIIIESVSPFAADGTCTVTYAVADADTHVAKSTRQIRYTDYTSPKFTLQQPLLFPVGTIWKPGNLIGAVDQIDGDISERVLVTASNYQSNSAGVYTIAVQVGNSKGDTVYLDLPIYVEEWNQRAPVLELDTYLLYVPKGETPDFASYIASVTSPYSKLSDDGVRITEAFQPDMPGVYSIWYTASDILGNEGHTVLTVVVEE